MEEKIRQMKLQSFDMRNHLKDLLLSIHLNELLIIQLENKINKKVDIENDYINNDIININETDNKLSLSVEYKLKD